MSACLSVLKTVMTVTPLYRFEPCALRLVGKLDKGITPIGQGTACKAVIGGFDSHVALLEEDMNMLVINMLLGLLVIVGLIVYLMFKTAIAGKTYDTYSQTWVEPSVVDDRHNRQVAKDIYRREREIR